MEDVAKVQHLLKRGGRFYFRIRVPDDVASHLGKEFIQHSLKTSNRKQAIEQVNLERVKADELFRKTRAEMAQPHRAEGQKLQATKTEIERIILLWFREEDEKRAKRDIVEAERMTSYEREDAQHNIHETKAVLWNDEELPRRQQWAADELKKLMKKHSFHITKLKADAPETVKNQKKPKASIETSQPHTLETEEYQYFVSLCIKAMRELLLRSEERLLNRATQPKTYDKFFAQQQNVVYQPHSGTGNVPVQIISLGDVAKEFLNDPTRNLTEKSRLDYEYKLDLICRIIGADTPLHEIKGSTAYRVIEVLKQYPTNAEKYFPNLPYDQQIKKAAENGLTTLSDPTINKFMEKLSAVFKFAIRMGYISANTVEGIRLTISAQHKATARMPFTIDQLNWVFRNYMHWGWNHGTGDTTPPIDCLWIPLISLFSGMRRAEVCQLLVSDIRNSEGVEFFCIEPDETEEHIKSVKTQAGKRNVPIHPRLKQLGFMEYLGTITSKGEKRLFPNIPRGDGEMETYRRFGDWFSRGKKGLKVKKVAFHSFRHNFQDELKNNGVDAQMQYWLCGWNDAGSSMATNYGSEPLMKTKLHAIERVVYEGLDLSTVEPLLRVSLHQT